MFKPHAFNTTIDGVPTIILSRRAHQDMWLLVDEVTTEVGWLGSASRLNNGNYYIDRIYLPTQEVHATTTELTPQGLADLAMDIATRPGGLEEANRLRFWGHSHVNMGTDPSGQDDDQVQLFKDNGCEWFIRGIFNKRRRAQFDLYLFTLGFTCTDVAWEVEEESSDDRRAYWKDQIAEKVSAIVYQAPAPFVPPGGYNGVSTFEDRDEQIELDFGPSHRIPGETTEAYGDRLEAIADAYMARRHPLNLEG